MFSDLTLEAAKTLFEQLLVFSEDIEMKHVDTTDYNSLPPSKRNLFEAIITEIVNHFCEEAIIIEKKVSRYDLLPLSFQEFLDSSPDSMVLLANKLIYASNSAIILKQVTNLVVSNPCKHPPWEKCVICDIRKLLLDSNLETPDI